MGGWVGNDDRGGGQETPWSVSRVGGPVSGSGLHAWITDPGIDLDHKGGGITTMSGTSMAAPHVCGLLLFGNPGTDGKVSGDPDGDADPIASF